MRRQAEAANIIFSAGLGVDHEDLGRGLFNDGAGDAALERVLGALGGEADDAVALADRLFPILDAPHKDLVVQGLPALVDDDDGGGAVEPLLHAVEEVHHGRGAHGRIVEQHRHVEADRPY
ncbi:hypothetical protein D3C85_1464480 [compost metagenome]